MARNIPPGSSQKTPQDSLAKNVFASRLWVRPILDFTAEKSCNTPPPRYHFHNNNILVGEFDIFFSGLTGNFSRKSQFERSDRNGFLPYSKNSTYNIPPHNRDMYYHPSHYKNTKLNLLLSERRRLRKNNRSKFFSVKNSNGKSYGK
jgi:hypothetical protein